MILCCAPAGGTSDMAVASWTTYFEMREPDPLLPSVNNKFKHYNIATSNTRISKVRVVAKMSYHFVV